MYYRKLASVHMQQHYINSSDTSILLILFAVICLIEPTLKINDICRMIHPFFCVNLLLVPWLSGRGQGRPFKGFSDSRSHGVPKDVPGSRTPRIPSRCNHCRSSSKSLTLLPWASIVSKTLCKGIVSSWSNFFPGLWAAAASFFCKCFRSATIKFSVIILSVRSPLYLRLCAASWNSLRKCWSCGWVYCKCHFSLQLPWRLEWSNPSKL